MKANDYTIQRVRLLLEQNNMLQKQLAVDLKIPLSNLKSYLTNRSEFRIDVIVDISKYFNVSTDYLLGITDNKYGYIIQESNELEKYLISTFNDLDNISFQKLTKDINKAVRNIKSK